MGVFQGWQISPRLKAPSHALRALATPLLVENGVNVLTGIYIPVFDWSWRREAEPT
jgi:hypothetical protein